MILVDTSIWIDHLRSGDEMLAEWLRRREILMHPHIIGELAVGNLKPRGEILEMLQDIPQIDVATDQEVLHFIETAKLFGEGIGYIDAHLLSAVRLRAGSKLWTRDKRLFDLAAGLNLAASPIH